MTCRLGSDGCIPFLRGGRSYSAGDKAAWDIGTIMFELPLKGADKVRENMAKVEGGSQFQRPCQIATKFQAATFWPSSPGPGPLIVSEVPLCRLLLSHLCRYHAGSALCLLLPADCCLFHKLPPLTSA